MHPDRRKTIVSIATCVIIASMLLSTIPPELSAKYDQRYTTTNESFTLYFDETFEYESVHSAFSQPVEIMSIDSMNWATGTMSGTICNIIKNNYWGSWNCLDWDDSNNVCYWGCHLEFEEYTADVEFVYEYEIRHHGSATFDVSTTWASGSAPVSTVTLSSSSENFVVSAKAELRLEVVRTFVGATSYQNDVRNTITVEFPFVSPTDIDGGGNTITVGSTTLYVWDDFVQFATLSGQNNAFGTTLDLDGDITIASIDLLEIASELVGFSQSLALDALGYVIEVNLAINLDFEVDMLSRVQTFLGTDSISSITSDYWSESSRAAYGNLLSNQGSFTSSVVGSGTDVNGVLGLHHMISTQESYSTNLVIEPETDTYWGQTIWNFFTTASSYTIPLSTGWFPSSSSGSSSLLTSEDFTVDAPSGSGGGGGGSGNSPPSAVISFTSTAQSSIQIEVGDAVTVSTAGTSDPDGDSLTGSLNWGDGGSESWNQGIPSTTSHTYSSVGSYSISALASDGSSNSFSNILNINVVAAQFAGTMDIEVYPNPITSNQGLVGHWMMDDSSGSITDSSGYLHWGVSNGSPAYDADGRFHRAIEFDGTDDYFDVGPSIVNLVGNSEEFTLSAWVKTASSGSMQIINAGIGNSWLGSLMILSIEEGNARVAVPATDMNYPELLSTSDINDGDWHLITGTFVSSGSNSELNLYIDGTLDGTLSGFTWDTRELNHDNLYNDGFYIGTENKDSPSGSYYSGLLDEVSVHDRALTATEVSNMFSSASANPQSVTEGQLISLVYTASSGNSGLNYYIGDGAGAWQYVPAPGTEMQGSLTTSWTSHGSYFPSIYVYDADWNHIGYHSTEVEAIPDISNGGLNGSSFEIVGDQILIVMDDEGYELGVNRTAAPHQNSNNSVSALTEALAAVSGIRGVDFDVILVGDTDWDYKTDTPGADGPGLNFLKEYSTVVWTTGNSYQPLTNQDQSVLRTYVGAGGSLVMFSQDLLWGECSYCSYWEEGSFARDVFGVRYSAQDSGEPEGNLSGRNGEGNYNLQYFPLAGLDSIEISPLNSSNWQDIISIDVPGSPITQGFEHSIYVQDVEFEQYLGDWDINSTIFTEGSYSATSGEGQGHSETRDMEAYINSSSNYTSVSFDLRVLSESGYDFLRFYVDGTEQDSWSGNVPWQRVSYTITSGYHTLRWSYQKDSSVSWGLDRAWVDNVTFCCTLTDEDDTNYAADILLDEDGNNFAIVKMHSEYNPESLGDGGGRAALYTIDPVQLDNRYDLETMLMQSVDWSDNELGFNYGALTNASYVPVGIDAAHPAPYTTGGTAWFQSRLFAGQNVRIASAMHPWYEADYDVVSLEVTTPGGTMIAGAEDPDSAGMELEFQADEGGVYLISVTTAVIGDELGYRPWFQLSITHLSDDNIVWLAAPTPITIDDSPVTDALAPQNWATQVGGVYADYSDSAFVTESLTQGERYGFGMLSLGTVRSPDLQIYFLQNGSFVGWASGYLDGGELYTRLVAPNMSGPYEIQIYNLDEYGNPHLDTFSYSVEMWSLPDCEPGTYQDPSGLAMCIEAPPGSYADDPNATSATVCPAGTYQPASGQASCIDAAGGHYVQDEGSTSQTPCPAGTYNPSVGATSVDECIVTPAGGYSAEGSASPENCSAGTYGAAAGATSDSVCIQVPPGRYSGEGASSPVDCSPGTYQPYSGQSSCLSADAGQFVAFSGSPSQTPCPPGTYQSSIGQVSCLDTTPGQYSGEGASSPVDCSPGTYQPYSGQSSCLDTTPGHYTSDAGRSEQIPAPLDEYVVGTASSNTQDCPPSYITLQVGADSEEDCYLDSDGDRIHDTVDSDDDGDGVDDGTDLCPLGNMGWSSGPSTDNDEDGCRDADEDSDDDNDGFPDDSDSHPLDPTEWSDNDMDGIGDNQDLDDDNDGVDDLSDVYPLDGTEWEDRNGDGLGDNANPLSLIDHMKLNPALTGVGAFALLAVIVGLVLMRRKSAPAAEDWKDDSYQSYSPPIKESMQPREESESSGRGSDAQGHHDIPLVEEEGDEEAEEDKDERPPPPPGFEVPPPPPPQEPDVPQLPPGVPPIPDDGLPEGWSIDQWIHYGKPWLDNQKAGEDSEEE